MIILLPCNHHFIYLTSILSKSLSSQSSQSSPKAIHLRKEDVDQDEAEAEAEAEAEVMARGIPTSPRTQPNGQV